MGNILQNISAEYCKTSVPKPGSFMFLAFIVL